MFFLYHHSFPQAQDESAKVPGINAYYFYMNAPLLLDFFTKRKVADFHLFSRLQEVREEEL